MSEQKPSTELAVDAGAIDLKFGDKQIAVLAESSKGLDLSTPEGYESARQVIRSAKQMRSGVESSRKEIKAFYLEEGRKIDAEAKRLVALIEEFEKPLAIEKKSIDDAKAEAKRLAAEAKEAERLEAERVERERIEAERRAENERIRAEQEAEQAKIDAERREIEKQREAIRAEQEKLQAERDHIEAEKLEAERLERERIEAEEQAERDRLQEIEDKRIADEEAERERIEKIEAEKRAEEDRLEAERIAEERKPDRQKLAEWVERVRLAVHEHPEPQTEWGHDIRESIMADLFESIDSLESRFELSDPVEEGAA